ncbi:MAG: hypothetical protein GF388_01865 [Candidatus Aegiribacteria sp.]|nr:hypothetical protein [Candidatus Aegiribacteria sp.]MBD3294104.1 hypothetical protein [Candidatus Fermentibacteria bacterium]
MMSKERSVLVTGGNRTGTSWVGRMLTLSKELFMVWEPFNHLVPVPSFMPQNPLQRHFHRILPEEEKAMKRFIKGKLLLDIKRRQHRPPGSLGAATKFLGILITGMKFLTGGCRPLFKDPTALLSAEWIAREYDAHVLMMVRHPAAYVASVKRLGWRAPVEDFTCQPDLLDWLPGYLSEELLARESQRPEPAEGVFALEAAVLCWKVFHETIFRYSSENPGWIVVRHEDLATNYLEGFRRLYMDLGLEWGKHQAEMVEKHCSSCNELVRGRVNHEFRQDSGKVVRAWMEDLNREELETVRNLASPVWEKYYTPASWSGSFDSAPNIP